MEETELQRRVSLDKNYIGPCLCENGIISFKNNGDSVQGNPLVSFRGPTTKAVRRTIADAGFIVSNDDKKFNLVWGNPQPKEYMKCLVPGQMIAHLAGQYCLTRKDGLGNTIEDACRVNPVFRIAPKSFGLPEYLYQYQLYSQRNPGYYVIKLANAARGEGVKIVHSATDIKPKKSAVIQEYIANPLLINGRKFDLRLYVVVTFVEPLTAYVYFDGLGRFATTEYIKPQKSNMNDQKIHLTNYSVNKQTNCEIDEYKWSFLDVINYIDKNYTDINKAIVMKDMKYKKENVSSRQSSRNSQSSNSSRIFNASLNEDLQKIKIKADQLNAQLPKQPKKTQEIHRAMTVQPQLEDSEDVQATSSFSPGQIAYNNIMHVIKLALIAAEPRLVSDSNNLGLNSLPKRQFGFFGFDVMLLSDLQARIIEVNVNPSTATEHKIDEKLKYAMLRDMFHLVGVPCVTSGPKNKVDTFVMSDEQTQRKHDPNSLLYCQCLKENEKKYGQYKEQNIKQLNHIEYGKLSRYEKLIADQLQQEEDRKGGFQKILPDPEYNQYFFQERYFNVLFSKKIIKQ